MLRYTAIALIVLAGFAGCAAPEQGMTLRHEELSEKSRITLLNVPGSFSYAELQLRVDGKQFSFGQFADFSERRYMVENKKDRDNQVEPGDVIVLPSAGQVQVELLRGDKKLASFEATIPDNKAPLAPIVREPANQADGVSRTPSFRWEPAVDPSGIRYTLMYSLDPNFAIPVLNNKAEHLDATQYTVGAGKELLAGQKYYWRVQAIDGAGNASPWSQTHSFAVADSS